jgi:hypothetical protein
LTWTPIVKPGDSSTELPVDAPTVPVYEGATVTPIEGRIDVYPELADAAIDDYIFVFPADSGMPPLYVVFKSPRDMPGVITGSGQPVSAGWLGLAENEGSPIPAQIGDQFRGRGFTSFGAFRKAFWKAVASDPQLAAQFGAASLSSIKRGSAPSPVPDEQVGGRDTFEIHHVLPIFQGGDLYDLDNLVVLTPKRHIKIHSKKE